MRKSILILASIMFLAVGCDKLTREREVDRSKLQGYDYRLFQKTPAWELAKAVWDDDFKKIDKLVKNDTSLINYQEPKYGQTLLFLTMWHNQVETFKFLLSLGSDPNIHDTYDGTSPIIEASKERLNIEFVMILLRKGANPNDIEVGKRRDDNHTRYTPLMAAAENGNIDLVELLVKKGANLNYKNEFDQSALSECIMQKKYEVAIFLLQNGADYKQPIFYRPDYSVPSEQQDPKEKGKPMYLVDVLREDFFEFDTDEYKYKMQIVDFLKSKGIDYRATPIPEYIRKKAQENYPTNWQEYLEKY